MPDYAVMQKRSFGNTTDAARQHDATPGTAQLGRWLNGGPAVQTQLQMSEALHASPAMVAQRRLAAMLSHDTIVQRMAVPDEDELLQPKLATVQRRDANRTGLPAPLKAGVESLSGLAMDDVRVHYNSPEPRQLQALAFAQGADIHVAPGQEQHLPHEAWHVVQQRQGRVQPTMQAMGVAINDDENLEAEADRMGAQAVQMVRDGDARPATAELRSTPIQRRIYQRVSVGHVMQLIYLWDRSTAAKTPHWVDDETPPSGYLPSGRFDDGEHGEDDVFARLGQSDLFYGLNYDEGEGEELYSSFIGKLSAFAQTKGLNIEKQAGFDAAVRLYDSEGENPLVSVGTMNAIYGGSSGWERYTPYLPGLGSQKDVTARYRALNPGLPWANNAAGVGCQVTMIEAIRRQGSVRFLLDGMQDIHNILIRAGNFSNNVTSHELRFALALLDRNVAVGDNKTVTPTDGKNVFFYRNGALISEDDVLRLDLTDADAGYDADTEYESGDDSDD